MSLMEAIATYRRDTPLRPNSSTHQADLAAIRKATRPLDKAARLVKHRVDSELVAKVDAMLFDLQGRKKRYRYDQAAAQQLEHIRSTPFDPITQVPLWRELLRITKSAPIGRVAFLAKAIAILNQTNLNDPQSI